LDPSGGAGLIADVKAFSAFGCFAAGAISSVTFQNTTGVFGAVHQSAVSVRRQVEPVLDDYEISGVKTGMLPTREVIVEVARLISDNRLDNVVVDPVVRSTSGFDLIDDAALAALVELLFPLADLITPNLPEAERITKRQITSVGDIVEAAQAMRSMGARNVLIKGGHIAAPDGRDANDKRRATDHLFIGEEMTVYEAEYIETTSTHGTGCILSSSITANLALGKDLVTAVRIAKDLVTEAIRTAPGLGKGNSPINI
jgi:hydroxymethylpyrimidine kinase/phosphomethylpyrimidine kinase